MLNQFELESLIIEKSRLLNIAPNQLPELDKNYSENRHCISIMGTGYDYYYCERGLISNLKTTQNTDELIFWIFSDLTFSLSINFQKSNRIENQDFRIILFKKHIELLVFLEIKQNFIKELKSKYNELLNQKLFEL